MGEGDHEVVEGANPDRLFNEGPTSDTLCDDATGANPKHAVKNPSGRTGIPRPA